jgi:hypothetical protein
MANYFEITVKKKDGVLVHTSNATRMMHKNFISSVKEGQKVKMLLEVEDSDFASKAQLAKIHIFVRTLSMSSGNSILEMKEAIKERVGLDKSFKDYTKEEMTLALQEAISLGEFLGVHLA